MQLRLYDDGCIILINISPMPVVEIQVQSVAVRKNEIDKEVDMFIVSCSFASLLFPLCMWIATFGKNELRI